VSTRGISGGRRFSAYHLATVDEVGNSSRQQ